MLPTCASVRWKAIKWEMTGTYTMVVNSLSKVVNATECRHRKSEKPQRVKGVKKKKHYRMTGDKLLRDFHCAWSEATAPKITSSIFTHLAPTTNNSLQQNFKSTETEEQVWFPEEPQTAVQFGPDSVSLVHQNNKAKQHKRRSLLFFVAAADHPEWAAATAQAATHLFFQSLLVGRD